MAAVGIDGTYAPETFCFTMPRLLGESDCFAIELYRLVDNVVVWFALDTV